MYKGLSTGWLRTAILIAASLIVKNLIVKNQMTAAHAIALAQRVQNGDTKQPPLGIRDVATIVDGGGTR